MKNDMPTGQQRDLAEDLAARQRLGIKVKPFIDDETRYAPAGDKRFWQQMAKWMRAYNAGQPHSVLHPESPEWRKQQGEKHADEWWSQLAAWFSGASDLHPESPDWNQFAGTRAEQTRAHRIELGIETGEAVAVA